MTDTQSSIALFSSWGSRPKGIQFGNGTVQTTSYTGFRGEVQQVHHQTSSQSTIVQLDYGYDLSHDRLFERFGGAGSSGDAFVHDRLRRLTNAWMGSARPSSPVGQTYTRKIDYNYDEDGNRTSVVVTAWGTMPGTTSYTTSNLYQYTSVGGTRPGYDTLPIRRFEFVPLWGFLVFFAYAMRRVDCPACSVTDLGWLH